MFNPFKMNAVDSPFIGLIVRVKSAVNMGCNKTSGVSILVAVYVLSGDQSLGFLCLPPHLTGVLSLW